MKFENITMSPGNLITKEDTVISPELQSRAAIGSIRIDMELHPFEMLELVNILGTTNLAVTGSRQISVDELREVLGERGEQLADISKLDYTPIGMTLYSCTGMFTGSNLFVLAGMNPSESFTEDENGKTVIDGNHMVINHMMNSIYSSIYTMLIEKKSMVKDNPLYKTRFNSSNGLPSLRYLSNSVITINMDEPDTKKIMEQMEKFKKVNAGDSQYRIVFYTAVFICNVTLKEYIEMQLTRPSCVTITDYDAINVYSKYPLQEGEDANDMMLARAYLLPEDYKMSVAVRVSITQSTMNILGIDGLAKTYGDIHSQLVTLIEKAGLITL
jgi:hypothetical protein